MKALTKKQHEVLQYIKEYFKTHDYAPSYREIMQYFSFTSLGTVYKHINILKKKGFLDNKKQVSRSLTLAQEEVIPSKTTEFSLPFIGYISAGEPIITFSKSLSLEVHSSLVEVPEATYVLRVRGNNLIEELMADGDYLLVEARQHAQNGETIVAMLNQNEILVKRYFIEDVFIKLVSHSNQNHPIIVTEDDLLIQGVVVGIIRKM